MDFTQIKSRLKETSENLGKTAKKYGKKAQEIKEKFDDSAVERFLKTDMVLKTQKEIEDFFRESKETSAEIKNGEKTEKKTFSHQAIVIFANPKDDIFASLVYKFPVLKTKTYSQGVPLKFADITLSGLQKDDFHISGDICLVLFENTEHKYTLIGEEKIQKVVNSLNLDINKTVAELA